MQYYSTLKAKLIYIFTIPDAAHNGCVKIGEATLDEATDSTLQPNCKELNAAARKRIDQYTKTAGIDYVLKHTELTVAIHGGYITTFNDKKVHDILLRSGIKRHDFSKKNQGCEWFECSVETALAAIQAAKEGKNSIRPNEIVDIEEEIVFRPEQTQAIEKTVAKFKKGGKNMLWNAKMRFGKTLSALQVVKEMQFHRTIIVTHRPVVDEGWFEDFFKIFKWNDPHRYGSKNKGEKFENLEKAAKRDPSLHYVYFASMQDLRGAQEVGGKFNKNTNILAADYDLLIVDEAHEGTQTDLGQNVLKKLQKDKTHVLNLSGTPFNLLNDYSEDEIYTWDYVMEQKAKQEWDLNHFGDPNPYAGLPRLNIFTFDLGNALSGFEDIEDSAFNFKEFFRTWTGDIEHDHREMPEGALGKFVHENHVKNFLDLIVKYDENSNYPFSTIEFRNSFRHTLWMVPGVKEARALSALLKAHPIFSQFVGANGDSGIVNVAGDGDEEVETDDALKMVNAAMGDNPEDTRTITLSCGKLTTGVTVRPWTAVMMLAGSHSTDAKAYMQTIFRVQSPYTTKDGRRKENCYVFDFAPDRTLKVLADTAKVQTKKTTSESERVKLGEFLNFCPVIGYNGTKLDNYDVDRMLEQLKRAYISRVTKNGCDDPRLYNQELLQKLDAEALVKFKNLHKIIGSTKANHTSSDVDMAKTGLTNEEYEEQERIKKKPKRERTPEE
nr:DEAD/DEAH box helicase family protein [Bacteroidales bacterium]